MWRLIAIVLLVVVGGLASGGPQFLHLREHEREDAAEEMAEAGTGHESGGTQQHHHEHSEQDCPVCAQLRAPMVSGVALVWVMEAGAWVRFVPMEAVGQWERGVLERVVCRGPPTAQV